jgi:hypothetical protein
LFRGAFRQQRRLVVATEFKVRLQDLKLQVLIELRAAEYVGIQLVGEELILWD